MFFFVVSFTDFDCNGITVWNRWIDTGARSSSGRYWWAFRAYWRSSTWRNSVLFQDRINCTKIQFTVLIIDLKGILMFIIWSILSWSIRTLAGFLWGPSGDRLPSGSPYHRCWNSKPQTRRSTFADFDVDSVRRWSYQNLSVIISCCRWTFIVSVNKYIIRWL